MAEFSLSSPESDQDVPDFCEFPPQMSYLPISDARDTPWSTEQFIQASRIRRERFTRSVQPVQPRRTVELPKIQHISGGFLRDNGRLLYTVKHSSVVRCLEYARTHWTLPSDASNNIKALAAMEAFLNPFDPVHWLFWSNDNKDQSAKLVQNQIGRRNPTIYHPLSWSILDWRFRLSGIHSKQLPQALSHKPWYDLLVLSTFLKDSPRGPVLRKRKAQPAVSLEQGDLETLPAKRSRMTRARASHSVAKDPIPNPDSSSPDTLVHDPPEPSQHKASQKASTARVPSSRHPRASPSSTSTASSPDSISTVLPPPDFPRTRSSSRLSAQTLVDETRDGSPSISSTATATDSSALAAKAKDKQKAVDELPRVIGVFDILPEDDASSVAFSLNEEETNVSLPRVTRSRRGVTKTELGPQRSQQGRESRTKSVHPYSSGKAVRSSRSGPTKVENTDISEAFASPSVPKKGRKTKNTWR